MTEIFNLSTLCRCCHSDGSFKSLNLPYLGKTGLEIYEMMLHDTLAIKISQPPSPVEASYTICDSCITKLIDATQFREQVVACEQKFQIYCTNEQFLNSTAIQLKTETESIVTDYNNDQDDNNDNMCFDKHYNLEPGDIDVKDGPNIGIKQEITIEVDIANPIGKKENDDITTNDDVKIEVKIEGDKRKSSIVKKRVQKKKSKEPVTCGAKHTKSYLEMRRKLFESYIVQVETNDMTSFTCKTCGGSYQNKKDIFKHITLHHHGPNKCEECGKYYTNFYGLLRHKKSHIDENQCKICNKKFTTKYSLKIHENSHTKQIYYQCDLCKKKLMYKNSLKKHILEMHSDQKKILCDICGWAFRQSSNLVSHIRAVHMKERPYSCTICAKTYTARKHLKNHIKISHSGNPKPYECEVCLKRFACPKSVKTHRLTHDNKFTCRYCSNVFEGKHNLDLHMRNHSKNSHFNDLYYTCQICGKVLQTKFTLNRHLELHTGVKRFSCTICGLKFTQKALVLRHMKRKHDPSVLQEKSKCEICKKSFRNIDRHMELHSADAKRFSCDICGKSYSENNALNRHKNQKHYGVSHDCDVCGKKYINKRSLETHKSKIHKIKKEIVENNTLTELLDSPKVT